MWMTRVAINHPVFATMVMVALSVLGIFSYQRLRVEAMPDVPVAFYGLVGETLSARELTTIGEQIVQKGLERVNGVGRVSLGGSVTRQIQVRVDSARLIALGLTVDQVVAALKNANVAVPV